MSANDQNEPPREAGLSCEDARELVSRHAKSELDREEQALFRKHILICEECRDAYRSAISMTAKVGHALSENRLERDRRQPRGGIRPESPVGPLRPGRGPGIEIEASSSAVKGL